MSRIVNRLLKQGASFYFTLRVAFPTLAPTALAIKIYNVLAFHTSIYIIIKIFIVQISLISIFKIELNKCQDSIAMMSQTNFKLNFRNTKKKNFLSSNTHVYLKLVIEILLVNLNSSSGSDLRW